MANLNLAYNTETITVNTNTICEHAVVVLVLFFIPAFIF
jgi:hypothetical protein